MASSITRKGQVTIPKAIRDRLGLEAGSQLEFQVCAEGHLMVFPLDRSSANVQHTSRFAALRGSASVKMTTDQILALTRGED